ncbi:hypothetical protein BDV19DRAFT_389938 [Aspergillus venezuelensis]
MDVLLQLARVDELEGETSELSGFFRAPATGAYSILSAATALPAPCVLNEKALGFEGLATGQKGPPWIARTDSLVGGRWYTLRYKGKKEDLTWQAEGAGGNKPAPFTRSVLLGESLGNSTGSVIVELMRASLMVDIFRPHAAEVEFGVIFQQLMTIQGQQRLDFNNLSL